MPPNGPIDPLSGPRYALSGQMVTMNTGRAVLRNSVLYIEAGRIRAIQPEGAPPPAEFTGAPLIATHGTIFPGMIELHNHLSYNILPLWDVPKKFQRRDQWSGHEQKRKLITGPMHVLGRTRGLPEAIARYTECKCLVSGTTTSQGIKLTGVGIDRYYKGVVRNVEQTDDPTLPEAATRIPDVIAQDLPGFFARLQTNRRMLLHLSEGLDLRSRQAFQALRFPNGAWAVTRSLIGIHCAALEPDDLTVLKANGAAMVWSPFSNLLLYGGTARVKAARDLGLPLALGSDWSPSGSKNLLAELKMAFLYSQQNGGLFTPEELVAMVTCNPAHMIRWEGEVGSLEVGKRADLLILRGQPPAVYEQLIAARESDVALVVINGVPRYGLPELMAPFGPGTEAINLAGGQRVFNLAQITADPLTQALSLQEARARLLDGLGRLPELAMILEDAVATGTAGIAAETGLPFPILELEQDELFTESQRPLLLEGQADFEAELLELLTGGVPYSQLLQNISIELDPLTVLDDPNFFKRVARQINLELPYKQGLAAFYGAQLPPPDGGEFIRRMNPTVRSQFAGAMDLASFLRMGGLLNLADRKKIVEQALVLLERVYVHLPLKRAMHAVDPVQRLRLLQYQLEQQTEENMLPELEFHQQMTGIFTSLRDLHTNYLLPAPYNDKTAFLPFLIEEYFEDGQPKYILSKILPGVQSANFQPGCEILYWNGIPIERAVEVNAERQAGSNPAARHARGLDSLTIRPLIRSLPPDEEWVVLRYRDLKGREREFKQKWLVFSPQASPSGVSPNMQTAEAAALGYDLQTDAVSLVKKVLYAAGAVQAELETTASGRAVALGADEIGTQMPMVFRAKPVENGTFGYIRIFTFNVQDAEAFVNEFVRLAELLPQNGLIVDVRSNGGGLIYAAERLLQVLTPRPIEPQRAQFVNTSLTRALCEQHDPSPNFPGLDLGAWKDSIRQSVQTGAIHSLGFPITPPATCNNIGQRYFGPVVLVTDALCYSATDLFAAGFQDHHIGPVLGTSGNTGAGGANVWTHALLDQLMRSPQPPFDPLPASPFRTLPHGAGMRVAVRSTLRVGPQAGVPVEDLGIQPDILYAMSRADLLEGNRDLIRRAGQVLAGLPVFALTFTLEDPGSDILQGTAVTRGLDRLDFYLDDHPITSRAVQDGSNRLRLDLPPGIPRVNTTLEIHGHTGDTFAALRKIGL